MAVCDVLVKPVRRSSRCAFLAPHHTLRLLCHVWCDWLLLRVRPDRVETASVFVEDPAERRPSRVGVALPTATSRWGIHVVRPHHHALYMRLFRKRHVTAMT